MGLSGLMGMMFDGPGVVRGLIEAGDLPSLHLALSQALWLKSAGHPEAQSLIAEAQKAITAKTARGKRAVGNQTTGRF